MSTHIDNLNQLASTLESGFENLGQGIKAFENGLVKVEQGLSTINKAKDEIITTIEIGKTTYGVVNTIYNTIGPYIPFFGNSVKEENQGTPLQEITKTPALREKEFLDLRLANFNEKNTKALQFINRYATTAFKKIKEKFTHLGDSFGQDFNLRINLLYSTQDTSVLAERVQKRHELENHLREVLQAIQADYQTPQFYQDYDNSLAAAEEAFDEAKKAAALFLEVSKEMIVQKQTDQRTITTYVIPDESKYSQLSYTTALSERNGVPSFFSSLELYRGISALYSLTINSISHFSSAFFQSLRWTISTPTEIEVITREMELTLAEEEKAFKEFYLLRKKRFEAFKQFNTLNDALLNKVKETAFEKLFSLKNEILSLNNEDNGLFRNSNEDTVEERIKGLERKFSTIKLTMSKITLINTLSMVHQELNLKVLDAQKCCQKAIAEMKAFKNKTAGKLLNFSVGQKGIEIVESMSSYTKRTILPTETELKNPAENNEDLLTVYSTSSDSKTNFEEDNILSDSFTNLNEADLAKFEMEMSQTLSTSTLDD